MNTGKFTKQYRVFIHLQGKFSGADGLQDFFFEANDNLHYYTFAFSEVGKRCKNYLKVRQDNAPTAEEYKRQMFTEQKTL